MNVNGSPGVFNAVGAYAGGPSARAPSPSDQRAATPTEAKRPVQPATKAESQKATVDNPEGLSEAEKKQVDKLKQRDREVRAHEQAHATVGGSYAGAPQYQFTKGPDGKAYATSGEVQIDISPEREPEDTIRKMDIVIAAALAPAEPSSQDYAVARQAQAQRTQAQSEVRERQDAELNGDDQRDLGGLLTGSEDAPDRSLGQVAASIYSAIQATAIGP